MIEKNQHSHVKIIFILAIIAMLVISFMSYVRIKQLVDAANLVSHTQIVMSELNKTSSILKEVESSQRGYMLTKDSVFLSPVLASNTNLNLQLDTIASLTKDNPSQQKNVSVLRIVVFKRLDYLKKILDDAETSIIPKQRWLRGKKLMNDVNSQISKMENEENKLIKIRSASLDKSATITPFLILLLSIGSIIILAAAYFKIIRELKASETLKFNLDKKNEELIESNKELESFNYISSHDLQEPLRQIQNFASRINDTEQQNLSEKGKTYFEKMNNAANRMQTLIEDLLAYSRIKTGERKVEITDLNQIVKDVTEEFQITIDEKHATIEVGEMCDANIIPFQFRQLMHNLIGNSLKFSTPDIPPHIKISSCNVTYSKLNDAKLTLGKEYCHISITDNGIGFEPIYKDRIFEVFQRLHDKQKINGTGIGLAIVKKIVENHNGIITATSQLKEGATFDIYIPTT